MVNSGKQLIPCEKKISAYTGETRCAPLAFASHTIFPLKLDFAAEKGGMAVSAVWETGLLSRTLPIGTKE